MSSGRAFCVVLIATLYLYTLFPRTVYAGHIFGTDSFDHIEAMLPAEVAAGEEFNVFISFLDRFGKSMPEGWKPTSSLSLNVSQPASVFPPVLLSGNYFPGFGFRVSTKRAGRLSLTLQDEIGKVVGEWGVRIRPGIPTSILVELPEEVESGRPVTVGFIVLDTHGNMVPWYEPEDRIVSPEGRGVLVSGPLVRSGIGGFEFPLLFTETGRKLITIRDLRKGLTGVSGPVDVVQVSLPGPGTEVGDGEADRQKTGRRAKQEHAWSDPRKSDMDITSGISRQRGSALAMGKKPSLTVDVSDASTGAGVKKMGVIGLVANRGQYLPGVLKSVVVRESDRDGIVVFSTNGKNNFNVNTSAWYSRKWITIEFPDIEPDLPDVLPGGHRIIGDIKVEIPENGKGVRVSVEVLPVRIGYDIFPKGDSLILKVEKN